MLLITKREKGKADRKEAFSYASVQESEKPQGNLVSLANLCVVAGVDGVGHIPYFIMGLCVADAELQPAVYQVIRVAPVQIHLVILPQGVDEERLHSRLLHHMDGLDGIEQVGIVQHDL